MSGFLLREATASAWGPCLNAAGVIAWTCIYAPRFTAIPSTWRPDTHVTQGRWPTAAFLARLFEPVSSCAVGVKGCSGEVTRRSPRLLFGLCRGPDERDPQQHVRRRQKYCCADAALFNSEFQGRA